MEFEYGNEPEKETGVPFEPEGEDRVLLAQAVREAFVLRRLSGCDNVVRFQKGGGRFKVRLPEGEDLLEKTDFELHGTFRGMRMFRARIWMTCLSDDKQMHDPYYDEVEFAVDERGKLIIDKEDRAVARKPASPSPKLSPQPNFVSLHSHFYRSPDPEVPPRQRESVEEMITRDASERTAKLVRQTIAGAAAITLAGVTLLVGSLVWEHVEKAVEDARWRKEMEQRKVRIEPIEPHTYGRDLADTEPSLSDLSVQRSQ